MAPSSPPLDTPVPSIQNGGHERFAGSLDYRLLRRIAKQFMKTGLMDRGNTAEELTDSVLDDMLDEVLRVNRKDAERGYIAV